MDVALDTIIVRIVVYRRESEKRSTVDATVSINIGDSDVAEFTDPHSREEQEPQHQGVLHDLGMVHDLIEPPELLSGQDTRQTTPLLLGSQVTDLPHPFGYVPPPFVIQPLLLDQSGDLGDELSLA